MATDFTYNGYQIVSGGPFKPSGKDMPSDARTRVESYADIASIPNPHVGLKITVKVDETNNNKMTDYIVKSLKANSMGVANSAINEVVRYVDYLGASSGGSVSQEDINTAVNNYLTEHPVSSGATTEQAAQIEANRTAIGDANSGLTKEVNDIKNTKLQNLNTAILGINETLGDKTGLPSGDANVIASINRIDSKPSGAVTNEQISTAVNNYFTEHPIQSGATVEQAAQIEANRTAIGDTNSGLIKKVNDIENYVNEKTSNISILNQNGNTPLRIWAGTQQEYDELLTYDTNTVYLVEGGSIPTVTTYTVTNNLTNVTNSNTSGRIEKNTSYTAMLSPSSGYKISTVTVTMGGTDITSTAYSNGHIEISNVTGNIIITATGVVSDNPTVTYTITNNLTNVSTSNSANSIVEGSSYEAKLSVSTGYNIGNVSITMGGVDITSTCYNNKTITISSVTGNIVITAEAVESPGTTDIDSKYTLAYSLGEETVFDGSSNIETGVKLFDSDKDFTILADFTPSSQTFSNIKQNVLFRIKQSKAPWIGVDIANWNENGSTCGSRGSVISKTTKQGYILGKICTGVPRDTTNRLKFVIKRVSADKKMYFYDSQGLIGSYSDAGDVASNPITTTIKLGGYSDSTTNYMACTVHTFKVYFDAVDDSDITTLLE